MNTKIKKTPKAPSLKTRIRIAADCLRSGEGVNSRRCDACFEQGDGDDVVTALVYQCEHDAELYRGIVRCFGGVFPKKWLEVALKI